MLIYFVHKSNNISNYLLIKANLNKVNNLKAFHEDVNNSIDNNNSKMISLTNNKSKLIFDDNYTIMEDDKSHLYKIIQNVPKNESIEISINSKKNEKNYSLNNIFFKKNFNEKDNFDIDQSLITSLLKVRQCLISFFA